MNKKNQIVFYNILSSIILQGVAFFTTPLFSRMLGTENYGIVSAYIAWVQIVSIAFGLQTMVTIPIAQNDYKDENQASFQSSVFTLSVLSFVVLGAVLLVLPEAVIIRAKLTRIMLLLIILQAFGTFCVNFLNMKQIYEWHAGRNLLLAVTTTLSTAIVAIFLIHGMSARENYWGYIIGYAVPYFIIAIIICTYIFATGKKGFDRKYWKFCLPLSMPVVIHGLSNILLSQSDRIMLQQMLDNSSTGIYSLAITFSGVLVAIYSALNNSWVPFFYKYVGEKDIDRLKKHARNYVELFTVITAGFLLLTMEVYKIFAREDFFGGFTYIPIMAVSGYFTFLYSFPVNYEFCKKKTSIIAIGTFLSAMINILLNFFLIHAVGAVGAAIATLVSHILLFIFHHLLSYYVVNQGDYPFRLRFFLPYLLSILTVILVVSLTKELWWVRFGLAILLGLLELYRIIQRKAIF